MNTADAAQALDRHVLAMTIWLVAGLVAATLFHFGLGHASWVAILGAFLVVVAAFCGHVVLNAVYGCGFTRGELALGLVLYVAAALAFILSVLGSAEFRDAAFLPGAGGFVLVFATAVFYLVTRFGVRGAFEGFDVIRSFRARTEEAQQ